MINGLKCSWSKASNRAGNQNAAGIAFAHIAPDLLYKIKRSRDVGIDHTDYVVEILIEEALGYSTASIRQ